MSEKNNDSLSNGLTDEEKLSRDEKFRTFFTNSVVDIPASMTNHGEDTPQEPKGLFGRLFGFGKSKEQPGGGNDSDDDVGELMLNAPAEEEMADLEMAVSSGADTSAGSAGAAEADDARSWFEPQPEARPQSESGSDDEDDEFEQEISLPAEPEYQSSAAAAPVRQEPVAEPERTYIEPAPVSEPVPVRQPEAMPAEPAKEAEPEPAPVPEAAAAKEQEAPAEPAAKAKHAPAPESKATAALAEQKAPAKQQDIPHKTAAASKPGQLRDTLPTEEDDSGELAELRELLDRISLTSQNSVPRRQKPKHTAQAAQKKSASPLKKPELPRLFGVGEDEGKEADLSLPISAPDAEQPPEAPADEPQLPVTENTDASAAHDAKPEVSIEAEAEEPETPESIAERLKRMSAALTLRCVLSGVLALLLIRLGLSAEGLASPIAGLDAAAAPAVFYGVNLVLYIAAMAVGYSVVRDGLEGLRGRASSDTMPALAAVAALIQALVALLNAESYAPSSLTVLSGMAALGLFMALLGSRVMLAAVRGSFELAASGIEHNGAYRLRDKDAVRVLARGLEQEDLWILASHLVGWESDFVDQCFDERAGERRSRKLAYVLLAAAAISGLLFLLFGAGVNGAAAAFASVLCIGAPLSSALVPGIVSLRLQRTAGTVGAMVPGWAAIEELGGIDTVHVDAEELFSPECVSLEDIRVFKGGRIDRAILYAASILGASCNTLHGLFLRIIEERADLLFPVKDLEVHSHLGFSAWCDNNHILIGTREYMESEGVLLPEPEYEARHSHGGRLQILYLAVSGSLHAMFVLSYKGGRNAARGLAVLQKENIRLMVSCQDPSLTAEHIASAYHLPHGMITLLDGEQDQALAAAAYDAAVRAPCCMVHLKGFVSLTGGLLAAAQAQSAELSATTVQLCSVIFSVIIAALLTSAGSIGAMSVMTALMYQAAWSALSIAVCIFKQHK